jgi:hypothetical protein
LKGDAEGAAPRSSPFGHCGWPAQAAKVAAGVPGEPSSNPPYVPGVTAPTATVESAMQNAVPEALIRLKVASWSFTASIVT